MTFAVDWALNNNYLSIYPLLPGAEDTHSQNPKGTLGGNRACTDALTHLDLDGVAPDLDHGVHAAVDLERAVGRHSQPKPKRDPGGGIVHALTH